LRDPTALQTGRTRLATLCIAAACCCAALLGTVVADSRWLAALGDTILDDRRIPKGVPFASAPSAHWVNVPALGEIVFGLAHEVAGVRGLLVLQVLAVLIAFCVLAADMRAAGARDAGIGIALLLVIVAAFQWLFFIRSQLFSLALFPLLVALLRSESRLPSRRIWLLVPLVALWSNLHGAVLVGVAVSAAYLLVERARREILTAAGVLVAELVALCLTPGLWRTPRYYYDVLKSEAARRGVGQWASFSFHSAPDVILAVGAVPLLLLAVKARPRLWEWIALAELLGLTINSARIGAWLVLFASVPAAAGIRWGSERSATLAASVVTVAFAGLCIYGIVRGPLRSGASPRVLAKTLALARGTPVLATDQLAEQVALAGGRIWVGNPLDAFPRKDQRLYLDWQEGRPAGDRALTNAPRAVLVARDGEADRRLRHLGVARLVARDSRAVLYVRRS